MPNIVFNYGSWEFWEEYNPDEKTFGNQKVTFDGDNKLILINEGVTDINIQTDIYSNWKEWVQVRTKQDAPNAKWPLAISAIGGQSLTNVLTAGRTFFLENGWRIKPWSGFYQLTFNGNIFTREVGENPVVAVPGVSTVFTVSNLVDVVETEVTTDVAITSEDRELIAQGVWDVLDSDGTRYGDVVETINVNAGEALKKGEWIALR